MAIPVWQPSTLYPTGSIVRSTADLAGGAFNDVDNGGFETGTLADWTYQSVGGSVVAQVANTNARTGLYAFYWPGGAGTGQEGGVECFATSDDAQPVTPGLSVTAKGWFRYNTIGDIDGSQSRMYLQWYGAGMTPLSTSPGSLIKGRGNNNKWVESIATDIAPAGAEFVAAAFWVVGRGGRGHVYVDDITWNYTTPNPPEGLVFKAVQPGIGTSDATEPVWPTVNGVQVTDGTVIWEALIATRITYRAVPILKSGTVEPTWPTTVGESVADNTISWQASTRQVVQAPNSKVWAITASKVYAADGDIIKFSATVNPLDWETADDAGYLPSGLNQNGSNDTAVLNIYRSALVSFSSTTFQNWQVDPDPANMALLDVMEGIGSTWQHAAQPVGKDLFYLAKLGVRTVGISAGSTNLVNGDVGMPIDTLVRDSVKSAEYNDSDVNGLYYPSLGQYWLTFSDFPPPGMYVTGEFDPWIVVEDYEGRISFGNDVGNVSIAWTGGDPLPTGATLTIDNSTKEIILFIPAEKMIEVGSSYDFTFILTDSLGRQVSASRSVPVSIPEMLLVGSLVGWLNSTPYSDSLAIVNNIGDCTIVSVSGDTLPLGWSVSVDNDLNTVVISGPMDTDYPTGPLDLVIDIKDSADRMAQWIGSISVTAISWLAFVSGDSLTGGIFRSPNGIDWPFDLETWGSLGMPPATYTANVAYHDGGQTVLVLADEQTFSGVSNSRKMTSLDQYAWVDSDPGSGSITTSVGGPLTVGGGFVFIGAPGSSVSCGIARSATPAGTYTYLPPPVFETFNLLAFLEPGTLMGAWTSRDYVHLSSDYGTTMVKQNAPVFGTNINLIHVAANASRFFACAIGGVKWSPTGLISSWVDSVITLGGRVPRRIIPGDGSDVIVVCDDGAVFYSTDNGENFYLAETGLGADFEEGVFAGGRFVLVGGSRIATATNVAGPWVVTVKSGVIQAVCAVRQ